MTIRTKRIEKKRTNLQRIRQRIRKRVGGTGLQPRLSVYRSLKHIYAQAIDDESGRVLAAACSLEKEGKGLATLKSRSQWVGQQVASRLVEKGVQKIVFDRGGRPFHGNVKILADAARENGLKF